LTEIESSVHSPRSPDRRFYGAFEARQFRIVTGVQGEKNVEVLLNVDLARHVLRVTVECGADSRTDRDDEGSLFERVALA
jgi:hypothetical protein